VFLPFLKLFYEGGWVLFPIFAVSVVAWHIAIGKLIGFARLRRASKRVHAIIATPKTPNVKRTGYSGFDVFINRMLRPGTNPRQVERAFKELLIEITPKLDSGFSTITA